MKSVFLDVVGYTPRNKILEYFVMARKLDVTISEIIDEYNMNKATTYNVVKELPSDIVLVTAISKANRLLEYLPNGIDSVIYEDHHNFTQKDIDEIVLKYPNQAIITTAKDMVKLEKFTIEDLYLMDLELIITEENIQKIDEYIAKFK